MTDRISIDEVCKIVSKKGEIIIGSSGIISGQGNVKLEGSQINIVLCRYPRQKKLTRRELRKTGLCDM